MQLPAAFLPRPPRPIYGRARATGLVYLSAVLSLVLTPLVASAQPPAAPKGASSQTSPTSTVATVRGTVADPDAAVIPGATVTLTPATGKAFTTTTGSDGSYSLRAVPPGTYSLTVTMPGFATFVRQGVRITSGLALALDAKLAIQNTQTEVTVTANPNAVSVDPDSNSSSTVIKGADLDSLSDDPDDLSSELTALAGPAAGPNGGQIYIDGFTGGQLPPKSSIREIRINQNPFSAQYDRVGYGRVEIFTKPGTDKLHGNLSIQGNDSVLNTSTPFLGSTNTQPNYYTAFILGSVTGPINKFSSFTVSGSHRSIQTNTLINPTGFYSTSASSTTLCDPGDLTCGNQGGYPTTARAIPAPQSRSDISPRVDIALGEKNTLTLRYKYETNNLINQGLGTTTLPSAALNTGNTENTIQISDTQLLSSKIVNETRFEYEHDTGTQLPVSSAPTLSVQGYFTGGGNNSGISDTTGSHIEFQNYTSLALAKNFIRFGGRLRTTSEQLNSNAGANGTFTYNYLLDPCVYGTADGSIPSGCVNTTTPCQYAAGQANAGANSGSYYSSYQCALASQYNITQINRQIIGSRSTDVGLYVEDDWKARPNLTVSYGLRLEAQNNISSGHDFAPRLSISYGLPHKGNATPTVLRAGYGIFYDRFSLGDTLTNIRLNGSNQVQQTYNYPGAACQPSSTTACTSSNTSTAGLATQYILNPSLRSSYNMQTGIGVDQQLGRLGTVSVNYINTRGVHQFFSRAYVLPTVYDYQYASGGIFKQNQLLFNARINTRRVSLFGFYALGVANGNSNGADTFLTSPNATATDFGRSAFNRKNFAVVGGSVTAPYRFSLSPFLIAQSGQPYNVTTGTDVNRDSNFNDRPSFLPGASSANCSNAATFTTPALGTTNYKPIPINYCTGPALFSFNLRVGRTFGFGPLTDRAAAAQAQGNNNGGRGGPGGFGPPGGGRGGPGGGGPGGGGPGGFGGATNTGHKYNLTLGAQAFNLFNIIPYGNPVSQLTSNRFGQFISLSSAGQGAVGTAVRRFFLQATLNF